MRAVQLVKHGVPGVFELRDVADPRPGPGEVLMGVRACGLNHLDLWLEEGALPIPLQLPRTPGGEIAGFVETVGPDVQDWQPGQRVAIQSNLFCGICEFCAQGEESLCLNGELLGVQRDGGFAEKVLAPARALVELPETVSFEASAALTLAGSTAMHMLTHRSQVRAGDWVLAIGASSGVGSSAIQIAKSLGARVITTGSTAEKRRFGLELGALHAVDPANEGWPGEVRRITGKRGVDVVIEHVGGKILEQSFQCLARGGPFVTCGATAGREVSLNLWPFFVKQQRLVGSYGRNRSDIRTTLEWAALGKLKPLIQAKFPLAKTADAFQLLRERSALGKVIVSI